MIAEVKFGSSYKPCTIAGPGQCKHCGQEIIWARTERGKFIPLNIEEEPESGAMTPHFGRSCTPGSRSSAPPPRPEPGPVAVTGIEMPMSVWKGLLMLVHPDRYHGSANEQLAASLTRWLLEQKPKLSERRN